MRRWLLLAAIVTVGALALIVGACAGGDDSDDNATTSPPPSGDGSGAPPSSSRQLPAEFVKCMADQGFEIKSPADIHSAPPQVLQACLGALHQSGG